MAPKTFLDLPAELRNTIYELTVLHRQTDNIISPPPARIEDKIRGRWFSLSNGYPKFEIQLGDQFLLDRSHHQDSEEARRCRVLKFDLPTGYSGKHVCSPLCLLQPDITRTSRQVRRESLRVFYGLTSFHFDMSDFPATKSSGQLERELWSPVKWWRAIGDANLQLCGSMTIVCYPSRITEIVLQGHRIHGAIVPEPVIFEYRHSRRGIQVVMHHGVGDPAANGTRLRQPHLNFAGARPYDVYRRGKGQREGNWEGDIRGLVEEMERHGMGVRVLERVLLALEPCDGEYVPDHSALGDNIKTGFW